jgi:uncharacterized membrane protein
MTATDNGATAGGRRRSAWLKGALVASLALNLLFIGGGLARFFLDGPPDRFPAGSQLQLVPRKFFGDLDRARRTELLQVFRGFGKTFREGRKAARQQVLELADALDADPYDPARVKAVIDDFAAQSSRLIDTGGQAALTLIARLTPEERHRLAMQIRQRDAAGRGEHGHGGGPPSGTGD